ncbi:MAG: hypothetical protein FWG05_06090, partial [Kiritimatiellaeota bacterium]|nr:hypothetical protein [Kiritimatiellota bacterium]
MAKKSLAKRLRNAVIALVVLIVAVFLGLRYGLEPVIIKASGKFGPKILGVEYVKIGAAKFNVLTGTCRISDVAIGPPEGGFKQDVFDLGDLRIGFNVVPLVKSLITKDPIVVREIIVEAPKAAYELSGIHSNISAITKKLENEATKAQAKELEKEQNEGQKVIVEKFVFKNGSVKIASATLGGGVPVPLPNIELTDIGRKSSGITGLELTREIFASIG